MDNDESEGSLESVVELSDSNDESAKTFIVPIPGNLKSDFLYFLCMRNCTLKIF